MAIDPIRHLVSPRILAIAFVLPSLTLFADLLGIVGGCIVAAFSLDVTPVAYFNQVHKVLELSDVVKGLVKSFVFGIEIATIGCLKGFQVRGGAESVGNATTSGGGNLHLYFDRHRCRFRCALLLSSFLVKCEYMREGGRCAMQTVNTAMRRSRVRSIISEFGRT
jgi:hypothetical protein